MTFNFYKFSILTVFSVLYLSSSSLASHDSQKEYDIPEIMTKAQIIQEQDLEYSRSLYADAVESAVNHRPVETQNYMQNNQEPLLLEGGLPIETFADYIMPYLKVNDLKNILLTSQTCREHIKEALKIIWQPLLSSINDYHCVRSRDELEVLLNNFVGRDFRSLFVSYLSHHLKDKDSIFTSSNSPLAPYLFLSGFSADSQTMIDLHDKLAVSFINDQQDSYFQSVILNHLLNTTYKFYVRKAVEPSLGFINVGKILELTNKKRATNKYIYFTPGMELPSEINMEKSHIVVNYDMMIESNNISLLESLLHKHPNATLPLDVTGTSAVMDGVLYLSNNQLPKKLHSLYIRGDNVTKIGNEFLTDCVSLTNIDLSSLTSLQSIGNYFLSDCKRLTDIDLSRLTSLQSIGNYFLFGCKRLTDIDLSSLISLQSIGEAFLANCKGLTDIDLSRLTSLQSINARFLSGCVSLTNIDLSSLTSLQSISSRFLFGCKGLTNIDLSRLTSLKSISFRFLSGCKSLTNIDLSRLTSLKSIGNYFLSGCESLTYIDLSSLTSLQSIDEAFLSNCKSLTNIDLSRLTSLQRISFFFLSGCESLTDIDLSSLTSLQSISGSFLFGCKSLTNIDLSRLTSLQRISFDFLFGCKNLTNIDLSSLTSLQSIGNHFLYGCNNLKMIIFGGEEQRQRMLEMFPKLAEYDYTMVHQSY